MNKSIIIDVREQDEITKRFLESKNSNVEIKCIFMSTVESQKNNISEMAKNDDIYIVCRTGRRAELVKQAFFLDNKKIIAFGGIDDTIKKFENIYIVENS